MSAWAQSMLFVIDTESEVLFLFSLLGLLLSFVELSVLGPDAMVAMMAVG